MINKKVQWRRQGITETMPKIKSLQTLANGPLRNSSFGEGQPELCNSKFSFCKGERRATWGFGVFVGAPGRSVLVLHVCSERWAGPAGDQGTCGWVRGAGTRTGVLGGQRGHAGTQGNLWICACLWTWWVPCVCLCQWPLVSASWRGGGHLSVLVFYVSLVRGCGSLCDRLCQCPPRVRPCVLHVCVCLWDKCSALLLVEPSTNSLQPLGWERAYKWISGLLSKSNQVCNMEETISWGR